MSGEWEPYSLYVDRQWFVKKSLTTNHYSTIVEHAKIYDPYNSFQKSRTNDSIKIVSL